MSSLRDVSLIFKLQKAWCHASVSTHLAHTVNLTKQQMLMLRRQQLQLTTSTSMANAWLQVAVTKHRDNKLAHASIFFTAQG